MINDKLCAELTKAFTVKTRQELDGCNSGIYKSYYDLAAEKFNDSNWVSSSFLLLERHDDYAESKMLVLQNCSKKLADEQYKMVKVIANWEKSGSGHGQAVEVDNDYKFIEGDDRRAFLRE